jgi:hypothetical protein
MNIRRMTIKYERSDERKGERVVRGIKEED